MNPNPQTPKLKRIHLCLLLSSILFALSQPSSAQTNLYTSAPSYTSTSRFVGAHVFHWYSPGNVILGLWQSDGPWRPDDWSTTGGQPCKCSWDGSVTHWEHQIKDMMDANLDVMYVVTSPYNQDQRRNLFTALNNLRSQGYDTPKVAPWLENQYTWNPTYLGPLDLEMPADKDRLIAVLTSFYGDYFSQNTDAYAADYLARIDNRVVINSWHWIGQTEHEDWYIKHSTSLTRADVESRLATALGGSHPVFTNGVYMMGSAAWDTKVPTWFDERFHQFGTQTPNSPWYSTLTYHNKRTATLLPGLWTDNIDATGGRWWARNGGSNFASAWNTLNQEKNGSPPIYHAIIESWNEYSEGSGCYAADPEPYHCCSYSSGHNDTYSSTNNHREYIEQIAAQEPVFTGHAARDAAFIYQSIPTTVAAGGTFNITVVARNEGSNEWSSANNYKLGIPDGSAFTAPGGGSRYWLDDNQDEIPNYGGIFRGRPRTFNIQVVAPATPGTYPLKLRMVQELVAWFGDTLTQNITVANPNQAQFISSTIPASMTAGQQVSVSVTFKNTGTSTWTRNANYKLGAVGDSDPFAPIRQVLNVGETVAPGAQRTFTFTMTAPSTPGTYVTDWRMVQELVEWFGDTHSKSVTVTSVNPPPTITQQPADQETSVGGAVLFKVTATGAGLSYQWQYSITGAAPWYNIGADSNSLVVNNVPAAWNGYQARCVVSNASGSATSTKALLSVYTPEYSESFATTRTDIAGKTIEVGGVVWAGTNCQIAGGKATGRSLDPYMVADVPVSLTSVKRVVITAKLAQIDSGYQFLGMVQTSLDRFQTTAGHAVYLRFTRAGAWNLYKRVASTATSLASGSMPAGWVVSGENNYKLAIDLQYKTVDLYVNRVHMVASPVSLGFTPSLTRVSFQGWENEAGLTYQDGDGTVDAFSIDLQY